MVFELSGKVALITGGVSGIGLHYAKELLRNGVKGVTLADINEDLAQTSLSEITEEFGPNRAQFVKTDTADFQQFENAFKKTIEAYKHVDILINNAGTMNDKLWEREVAINVNGIIHGMLLGLENYLQKNRQGPEAVIVNVSSITGIEALPFAPIYCATKAANIGLTKSWGDPYHYERTGVRVFVICPGTTETPLLAVVNGRTLGEAYEVSMQQSRDNLPSQGPEHVAKEGIKLIQSCPPGSIWVVEGGKPAYQFIIPNRDAMLK